MVRLVTLFCLLTAGHPVPAASVPAPETRVEPITFSYRDADFAGVFLSGSFTNWTKVPLVSGAGTWSITLPVPEGMQYYTFVVDDGQTTWTAIDPENPVARNHEEFGWVSVLNIQHPGRSKTGEKEAYRRRTIRELEYGLLKMVDGTYQRVDGLTLGFGWNQVAARNGLAPSVRLSGYYGFSSSRFGGGLTILQPILADHLLDLKVSLFDKTEANNHFTGIGRDENSLAGLLFHEDYRDYHRSKGAKLSLIWKPGPWLRLQGGIRAEDQTSLRAHDVWSIRRGSFSPNPAIEEGNLNSVFGLFAVGKRFNYFSAAYQRSSSGLVGGDFDFEKISAKLRGHLDLGTEAGIDVRLYAGRNLRGHLPRQERYLAGGLGTVRGYAYQSLLVSNSPANPQRYGGERMALGNLEYYLRPAEGLKLILFYDAGMVWEDHDAAFALNRLKTSTGLGVNLGRRDGLRLNMIQRLDDLHQPVIFQLRLKRMF